MHRVFRGREGRSTRGSSIGAFAVAVELAVPALRDLGWSEDIDHASELRIEVQSPTVVHTIDRFKLRVGFKFPAAEVRAK